MSHQPFESWLFEDEALEESDAEALRAHLAICQACRSLSEAWGEMEGLLRSSALDMPAPGFAGRWQGRLAAETVRRQRRQALASLGLTAGTGLVISAALAVQVFSLMQSPARVAVWIAENVSAFAAQLFLLREALADLAGGVPVFLASAWPFAGLAVLALMGALWLLSIYRYAFQGVRR
jgi:predicted anti-sigma-YlaC factor YlaD